VNVSFLLQIKGGETARIAAFSLLCLVVVVEWFEPFAGSKQVGGSEAPQFANADAANDSSSCVTLKGFGVNLNNRGCPVTVQQRLE
jgi:hypothetical protein